MYLNFKLFSVGIVMAELTALYAMFCADVNEVNYIKWQSRKHKNDKFRLLLHWAVLKDLRKFFCTKWT